MNLIYQSSLLLKEGTSATAEEHLKLSIEANNQTMKAYVYLSTLEKDCIYWNDEDVEDEFKCSMLGNVKEC